MEVVVVVNFKGHSGAEHRPWGEALQSAPVSDTS